MYFVMGMAIIDSSGLSQVVGWFPSETKFPVLLAAAIHVVPGKHAAGDGCWCGVLKFRNNWHK